MPKLSDLMKFGKRPDGSYKQSGYFGEIPLGNGNVATEYSVGVGINGKEMDIPTIIPTLTNSEMSSVLYAAQHGGNIPDSIVEKAVLHARSRLKAGRSPFWSIPERQYKLSDLINQQEYK